MPTIASPNEADLTLFRRELDGFVPDRIFDAHAHLWARGHVPPGSSPAFESAPQEVMGLVEYRRLMAAMLGGREVAGGLFIPGAVAAQGADLTAENELVAREVARDGRCRSALLVSPEMDGDFVRAEVRRLRPAALKCYHLRSAARPTWDAVLPQYLPEAHVRVADEEGLCIVLHLVRPRALADPSNQHWIRRYCERFPRMNLILAHAGRGFNPYHTIEGIWPLRDLPNLWCDMSAVTEVGACEAIIEALGHERLLYGSDFPVSHLRGRCVAVGDGFVWLYEETLAWETVSFQPLHPTLVGLESLRVLKQAAWRCRLSDRQVEDIFYNNAMHLFEG
ncbi:MAG: amidohydrolase family protein [Anaerolineae bacterium]